MDPDPGMRALHLLRHLIDKPDHSAGVAALRLVHCPAGRTLTGMIPVIHGYGKDVAFRMRIRPGPHTFGAQPQHIRVRQTQLGLFPQPDPVFLGEILRMRVIPAAYGDQRIKGMTEIVKHHFSALLRTDRGPG